MSATEREIRLRIVATDTHCGDISGKHCPKMSCGTESAWCCQFNRGLGLSKEPPRLFECIAAEGAGQKGGDR